VAEAVQAAAAELCIPGAGRSAARSCAAQEASVQAEQPKLAEQADAGQPEFAAQPRLSCSEMQALPVAQPPLAEHSLDAEARQPAVLTAQREQTVFPQSKEPQPRDAQQPAPG
jgi:hypothetical protein